MFKYDVLAIPQLASDIAGIVMFGIVVSYWKRGCLPKYLTFFPIYCLVNVITDWLMLFFPVHVGTISFSFGIVEFLFYAHVLTKLLQKRPLIIVLWIMVIVANLTILFLALYFHAVPYGLPEIAEILILFGPGLMCYKESILGNSTSDFLVNSSFWWLSGMMLNIVLLVPTMVVSSYCAVVGRPNLSRLCFSVNYLALIVSYFLYAKAIRCGVKG
jgi:hypothetical protein